jgi:hypothetical protein
MKLHIINYDKLQQDAKACNISVFLMMKRKINYRAVDINYPWINCGKCKLLRQLTFPGENTQRLQCETIGYNKDIEADVNIDSLCDCFKHFK